MPSAISFAEWLGSPDGGGLPSANIYTLVSPPTSAANPLEERPACRDIENLLSTLIEEKTQKVGQRLYFYFAGQGAGSLQDDVQLLLANAAINRPDGVISLRRHRQFLSRCFDEIVYIIDCAFVPYDFSGSPDLTFPTLPEPRHASVNELILMTSTRGVHEVEGVEDSSIGLLTKVVLEGLRGGAASRLGPAFNEQNVPEREITAVSLSDYVRARVRDLTGAKLQQLPELLLPTERMVFSTVTVSLLSGTLVVEVPHWTAEVSIYNNLAQLVVGPLELKKTDKTSPKSGDVYAAEVRLVEGIYRIDVSLEGKKETQLAVVQFNQTATIENESWKDLGFVSAAPLKGTASTHEAHLEAAIQWSTEITWPEAPGSNKRSTLYLFVRTSEPTKYPRFAEGLRLLDGTGALITDFSTGIEKDESTGWLAFRADLDPGYYILRRGRAGVRLRHQPLFLCEDWETHIFLHAWSSPSMRSQAVNMARRGSGFQPNDETAIAAEAVLDAIRYGGNIGHLVSHESLSKLLHEKIENPWLGVLAAYALRSQLDHGSEEDEDTRELLDHVMRFLAKKIGDHPDVCALRLDSNKPAPQPFIHPPLLIHGLRLVEHHSFRFKGTVPEGSLTDLVLDSLVVNSPWTAWRQLPDQPWTAGVSETAADEAADAESALADPATSFAATRLQPGSPKTPVLRISEIVGAAARMKRSSSSSARQSRLASISVNSFQDAQLLGVIQNLTSGPDLDELPETVTFNETTQAAELLSNINPGAISQAAGISLAHTEGSLQRLRDFVAGNPSGADYAAELRPAEKVSLEYALAESAKPGEQDLNEGVIIPHPAITIEDCVTAIRGEALRLLLPPEGEELAESDVQTANKIGRRLLDVANALLSRAVFTVTTDTYHRIIYCNRAFITLLTSDEISLTEKQRTLKKNNNFKVWQKALKMIPPGASVLPNPMEDSTPKEFRVRRTLIKEEETGRSRAYLNTLKGLDSHSVKADLLEQVTELIPDLTRQASFFWYDSSERIAYSSKLEHLTTQLEATIGATTNEPKQ